MELARVSTCVVAYFTGLDTSLVQFYLPEHDNLTDFKMLKEGDPQWIGDLSPLDLFSAEYWAAFQMGFKQISISNRFQFTIEISI